MHLTTTKEREGILKTCEKSWFVNEQSQKGSGSGIRSAVAKSTCIIMRSLI